MTIAKLNKHNTGRVFSEPPKRVELWQEYECHDHGIHSTITAIRQGATPLVRVEIWTDRIGSTEPFFIGQEFMEGDEICFGECRNRALAYEHDIRAALLPVLAKWG